MANFGSATTDGSYQLREKLKRRMPQRKMTRVSQENCFSYRYTLHSAVLGEYPHHSLSFNHKVEITQCLETPPALLAQQRALPIIQNEVAFQTTVKPNGSPTISSLAVCWSVRACKLERRNQDGGRAGNPFVHHGHGRHENSSNLTESIEQLKVGVALSLPSCGSMGGSFTGDGMAPTTAGCLSLAARLLH